MAFTGAVGNTSEETFDMLCSVCKQENKNEEAEKYCVDCQDYYCSVCLKMHATLPALKGHKLLDKEAGQSGKLLMVPTERCDRHNFKTVDMFCQNHDEIGCGTCMAVDHRACQDVFYIPEFVKTNTTVPLEFLQRLTGVETKLKGFLNTFEVERDNLQANKSTEIANVKKVTKKLEQRIKEAEQSTISDIEKKYNCLHLKVNQDIETLKQQLEYVDKSKSFVTSSNQNQSQVFVNSKMNQGIVIIAEKTCSEVEKIILGCRVKFVLDHATEVFMARNMYLGEVKLMPRLYSFVSKGTADIKLKSDSKSCEINGSCVLPDGSVVLSDTANKNLKLLDCSTLTVKNHHSLSSEPYEVCCVVENKIAVCLLEEKKITLLSYDSAFIPIKVINVDFACRGIWYNDDHFYISSCNCVYICNKEGHVLKTFDEKSTGQDLLLSFRSIRSSINGQYIYVCRYKEDKCVVTLGGDGHFLNVSGTEINRSDGLAVAEYGKLFVCEPRYVAQLRENGTFEFAITGETDLPQALCFNCRTGRLYLPNYKKDYIHVFEFEFQ